MKSGTKKFEVIRACPACSSTSSRFQGKKNGFGIFQCLACRSLFTDRVPEVSEAEDYDSYYGDHNLSVPEFIGARLREIIAGFEPYRSSNRLLDIGFGAGSLIREAQKMGWQVSGTEVSSPAFENLKKEGRDVFLGTLSDQRFPDEYFDVVTASEILEHLSEPVLELKEILRVLRPGGLFWGTTPSARALSFRLMGIEWSVLSPPEHIQLYSAAGASEMLRGAGFSSVSFRSHGFNPSEVITFFRKSEVASTSAGFSRVTSSYALNESFMSSPSRRFLKKVINEGLNLAGMGDSLKIFAVK
jgi:spore maturation protein CgeB